MGRGGSSGGRVSGGDKARVNSKSTGGGSKRGAALSESEITSSINRQKGEINGLSSEIRVAEEKLRESSAKFRRAEGILNDRLALNSQYRFARQLKREAIQTSKPLNKLVRGNTRKQKKLIAEIKKNTDLLRSDRK